MKHTPRSRTARLAWLAIPVTAGLLLAGCSSSGATGGKEPQTISFAYGATNDQDKAAYDSLAKAFEAENKGVTVTTQNLPVQSYATTIATRVQGGNAPDTFYAAGGTGQANSILPWAKSGQVLALDDASIKANIPDSAGSQAAWLSNTRRAASSAIVVWSASRRARGVSS
jgi:ABC-type glycerol-3-phosphate transport system substrate-binding protein